MMFAKDGVSVTHQKHWFNVNAKQASYNILGTKVVYKEYFYIIVH